jgi:Na+/H+ antiporter NhaD/arsenite permease-like protein
VARGGGRRRALAALLIAALYPCEFFARERLPQIEYGAPAHHPVLVAKSVIVTAAMVALFFAGQSVAKVAIIGGALLLLTRRMKAEKINREIDEPLLMMVVGLFIVVAGLEHAALTPERIAQVGALNLGRPAMLAGVTAVLSNLVSNVPAVLVLKPFVGALADPQRAWLLVAMASTLAGNFTIVGSLANLIVVEHARARGVVIGFWDYFKVGAPLTILTILIGLWRL